MSDRHTFIGETPEDRPHRRHNPLLSEWVLVSPHRTDRPWLGAEETSILDARPEYEPSCYLCPGNERAGGNRNPAYEGPFAFENDFAALVATSGEEAHEEWQGWQPAGGTCRVLCFSPRHDLTLARMEFVEIERVIQMWIAQVVDLGERYAWVQIFENHGSAMGASNPHPHGQVWATDYVPTIPATEESSQAAYWSAYRRPVLMDYLQSELADGRRVVLRTDHWVWLVPFWATWPFEVLLLPIRHVPTLPSLSQEEVRDLARILKAGLTGYDRLFGVDFPYSMGWHAPPAATDYCQLHAHFYPPLLRSATVRKFMVGFEMLGEAQRDITPEAAAVRLREVTPQV